MIEGMLDALIRDETREGLVYDVDLERAHRALSTLAEADPAGFAQLARDAQMDSARATGALRYAKQDPSYYRTFAQLVQEAAHQALGGQPISLRLTGWKVR